MQVTQESVLVEGTERATLGAEHQKCESIGLTLDRERPQASVLSSRT